MARRRTLDGGVQTITSTIAREVAADLGQAEGTAVRVLVKSTEVSLASKTERSMGNRAGTAVVATSASTAPQTSLLAGGLTALARVVLLSVRVEG